jgi:uncharacterized membrane protein
LLKPSWANGFLAGLLLLTFLELVWLSIARYQAYNVRAFDLGIMSQAIWSATQGRPLVFTIEGIPLSRLARHVELIYFLFAPLYGLWPSPETLLVLQVLLYIAGALPLYILARRRLASAPAAVVVVAIYLFYPVAQTAVLFDFHGDTVAMPLFLFVIDALDRKAWRSYAFWLTLALCSKFYIAGLVAALGGALWLRTDRRAALVTAGSGVAWGVIAFWLIRPLFAPPEAAQVQATATSYIAHYFGDVQAITDTMLIRAIIALIVYLPALIAGWRAPIWLLLASVIALPTLLSSGPGPSYDYRYHHYALAVPFLMAAIVYGGEKLRIASLNRPQERGRPWYMPLIYTLALTLLLNSLFVDTPLNLQFYRRADGSARGLEPSGYLTTPRDRFKDKWLAAHIPSNAPLAADAILAPHLTNRPRLYLTRHPAKQSPKTLEQLLPDVDYVVVDSLFDFVIGNRGQVSLGGVLYEQETISTLMHDPNFTLLAMGDGLLLFGRAAGGLGQQISTEPATAAPPLQAKFDDMVGLVEARIMPLENNRARLMVGWLPLPSLAQAPPLMAVSELEGVPHSRMVHLPTRVLHPTSSWQPDEIVHESFDIEIPAGLEPGIYPLLVGWYRADSIYAPATDDRTRIGNKVQLGLIEIPREPSPE